MIFLQENNKNKKKSEICVFIQAISERMANILGKWHYHENIIVNKICMTKITGIKSKMALLITVVKIEELIVKYII